jgi:hypothetical protein
MLQQRLPVKKSTTNLRTFDNRTKYKEKTLLPKSADAAAMAVRRCGFTRLLSLCMLAWEGCLPEATHIATDLQ